MYCVHVYMGEAYYVLPFSSLRFSKYLCRLLSHYATSFLVPVSLLLGQGESRSSGEGTEKGERKKRKDREKQRRRDYRDTP